MIYRCVCVRVLVIAGLAAALPAGAGAQQAPWPAPPPANSTAPWPEPPQIMREEPTSPPPRARTTAPTQPRAARPLRPTAEQPDLDDEDQLSPRQLGQPPQRSQPPQQPPATTGAVQPTTRQADPDRAPARAKAVRESAREPAAPAGPAGRALACGGVFAKDSSHLKLAMTYDSKNITFAEVAGPENSKLMASVLFPSDPKRRLEVLWENPGARAGTQLIVINGQSTWTAPKGLKLGMPLAALEKANGRPFRISGFGQQNSAQVVNWQGGALSSLPGGCKVGVILSADPQAPQEARAELPADKEFQSSDVNVRAAKPVIAEILLGY